MVKEFNFRFDELLIDYKEINRILGYKDLPLPAPFDTYLAEAVEEARKLDDIRAVYRVIDAINVEEKGTTVSAVGLEFKVGKIICGELKNSQKLAFFVCTAGKTLSEKSVRLLKGEDPVSGYIYDVLGSIIAETAGDKMETFLKADAGSSGMNITNRYSPGYCNWSVADQHKLFSLLGDSPSGVELTPSALMNPVKSISGIIGIGREVKYRDYQCTLCKSKNCVYRKVA